MEILITNLVLLSRTGTEIVVRDFALHMTERGHRVTVFAPGGVGALGEEIRARGIDVQNDVNALHKVPDIIHGHHGVPTLLAMARFPQAPAIWMSHDFRYWFDEPPRLTHVHRYFPVDETRRKFLVNDRLIPSGKVEILHNAVDLKRIPERSVPLGELPGGVLAFTKTKEHLDVLEGVCAELGVKFSALGRGAGREVATPEQELIRHDIVVATGRSAIEALCAGACVIVGDARGLSGIVSSENYQYHRSFNFGSETFSRPFTHDLIVKEIQKYNAADARAVTQRIRADANLEQLLDKLEAIYYQTLADAGPSVEQTPSDIRELWDTQKNWPPGNLPEWRRHRRALKRIIRRRYYLDRILSGFL